MKSKIKGTIWHTDLIQSSGVRFSCVKVQGALTSLPMWKTHLICFYVHLLSFWHCARQEDKTVTSATWVSARVCMHPKRIQGKVIFACSWWRLTGFRKASYSRRQLSGNAFRPKMIESPFFTHIHADLRIWSFILVSEVDNSRFK